MITRDQLHALAAAAVAAPSADNRHVFRLQVQGDVLTLRATEEWERAGSSRRVLGLLSMGAAAENLILRGKALGLQLAPRWRPEPDDDRLQVAFDCSHAPGVDDPLAQEIEARHTNRTLRLGGPPLSAQAREQLSVQAGNLPGTAVVWLDEPGARRLALRLIRWAEAERFRSEELHGELFDSIRFDAGWHTTTAEGLPPGALALPPSDRLFFLLLRHWRFQRAVNRIGAHRLIAFRSADLPCRLAPHLCAVAAQEDGEIGPLFAGRLLERLWLAATGLGLSVQVFAASPLYALPGATAVAPELQRSLEQGWRHLSPTARPYVVLRLGHGKPPGLRASRPAAETLLMPEWT